MSEAGLEGAQRCGARLVGEMKAFRLRVCVLGAGGTVALTAASLMNGCGGGGSSPVTNTSPPPPTPIITTVAGMGKEGNSGLNGLATAAQMEQPTCAVLDSSGNIYIADAQRNLIYKVTATTGIISAYAGTGTGSYGGDGGKAIAATMYAPTGCGLDASGNLFFSDSANNVVRRVDATTGVITTVAGNGYGAGTSGGGFSGDGGQATKAELNHPSGLAVDSAGNLFISDNQRVREVSATTGTITTVAGNGIYGHSGSGAPAIQSEIGNPEQLAVDNNGNVYIAEQGVCLITKVNLVSGILTIVAGNGTCGSGTGTGMDVVGDGGPATSAVLDSPEGVALNAAGNLFIADSNNQRVREVNMTTGIIQTVVGSTVGFSGDRGSPTAAQMHNPWGLFFDSAGNLYIADEYNGSVRKVTNLH